MATSAQRDNKVKQLENRVERLDRKVTSLRTELATRETELKTSREELDWTRRMPVSDAPETGEMAPQAGEGVQLSTADMTADEGTEPATE